MRVCHSLSTFLWPCFSSHVVSFWCIFCIARPGRDCKLSFSSRISVSLDLNIMDSMRQITVGISSLAVLLVVWYKRDQTGTYTQSKRSWGANPLFMYSLPENQMLPPRNARECPGHFVVSLQTWRYDAQCSTMLHACSYYHLLVAMWYDTKPTHWEHSES